MDTITIWHRTAADGTSGWEAVTVAPVVTHHTRLMPNIWQVQEVLNNMMDAGMMAPSNIVIRQPRSI
jgi:hypothetical protein